MYSYRARCTYVVDGDTVELVVDLGFHMTTRQRFRVLGVDTPELRGGTPETKKAAQAAKDRTRELLIDLQLGQGKWPLEIVTHKADSFGRWLVHISFNLAGSQHRVSLRSMLITEGHGVSYPS